MLAFSALADPTRLRIVEMLAHSGQLSAGNISSRFDVSAPAISQHLKVLREAGLVRMEAQAQQRFYSIDPMGMDAMQQWVQHTREVWSQRFEALDALLEKEMKKHTKGKRKPKHGK